MSSLHIGLAKANPATAARLAEVGQQTFTETFAAHNSAEDLAAFLATAYDPAAVLADLHDPAYATLVAQMQGELVGFAKVQRDSTLGLPEGAPAAGRLELKQLYVLEDWQGTGLGAALMRRVLDLAAAEGCNCVVLGVWEHNERALAFYQRFGFKPIGQHDFWVGQDRQTDLILRKGLAGKKS